MRAGSRRTSPAGARSRSNTSGAAGGCTGVSVSRSTREGLRRRALLDELISTPVEHELTRLLEGTDDPHDAALGLLDRLEAHRAEVVDLLGAVLSGDRKSGVSGKSGSVRVDLGGSRDSKKKKK